MKKHKGLKIAHLNVRSLLPKSNELRLSLEKLCFDVFSVTESWLDDSVDDHEVQIDGYQIIRADRNRHGGGVAIYIKSEIPFKIRDDLTHSDIENIWVEVQLSKQPPILICCLYRPLLLDKITLII